MPLQQTSGNATTDAYGGGVVAVPNYIEDVFSTWLYTGNGTDRTITNGIDLSTKGGLVWTKTRDATRNHCLADNVSNQNTLASNLTTIPSYGGTGTVLSYNTTGYNIGTSDVVNLSGYNLVSWTFRQQPKFFDVVTYTGTGSATTIAHSLGSVPGCIIIKRTDTTSNWVVYHRSLNTTAGGLIALNLTNGELSDANAFNSTVPTSTVFTVGSASSTNGSGGTFVAYVFAHDAGGFGLTGTDNVISCGTFSGNTTVTLGYEPQWIMLKRTDAVGNWDMHDVMRGWPVSGDAARLRANLSDAESQTSQIYPNATGFSTLIGAGNYIYIAIRRGPMKVPTSGTSVFENANFTSTASRQTMGSLPVVDMFMGRRTNSIKNWGNAARLTGNYMLKPNLADIQDTNVTGYGDSVLFDLQNGSSMITAGSGDPFITYNFHRAPSFFDVVCYKGTGSDHTENHNLAAQPEMIILKGRSTDTDWGVLAQSGSTAYRFNWNSTSAGTNTTISMTDFSTPTIFYVGSGWWLSDSGFNATGQTYVAYLFTTCAGVSKVGYYTGTGSTQTISCGFTGGARWVMIKRVDSTGGWYVWDTARGMVSGTDPSLQVNSTAAESNADWVYTTTGGFQIVTSGTAVNANGGSYIFLAIA